MEPQQDDQNKIDEECVATVLTGPVQAMLKAREMGMLGRRSLRRPAPAPPAASRPLEDQAESVASPTCGDASLNVGYVQVSCHVCLKKDPLHLPVSIVKTFFTKKIEQNSANYEKPN